VPGCRISHCSQLAVRDLLTPSVRARGGRDHPECFEIQAPLRVVRRVLRYGTDTRDDGARTHGSPEFNTDHAMTFKQLLAIILCAGLSPAVTFAQEQRPTVGVAFGGGSARGIAHVGVIRWFEEHRIPIDMAAGTSMGGLIGGAFATGMDSADLDRMLQSLNWDEIFG